MLARGEEARGPEGLDMAETSQDVPAEEPRVPLPVVAGGVGEHRGVRRDSGGPEGRGPTRHLRSSPERPDGRTSSWFTSEIRQRHRAVERPRRRHLGQVHVLVRRVRPPAGPRPALDRVGVPQEDPVRAGGAAEGPRLRPHPLRGGQQPGSRRRLAGHQSLGRDDHVRAERAAAARRPPRRGSSRGCCGCRAPPCATGGVTFRLMPASSMVGVAVVCPSTACERSAKSPSSLSRSRGEHQGRVAGTRRPRPRSRRGAGRPRRPGPPSSARAAPPRNRGWSAPRRPPRRSPRPPRPRRSMVVCLVSSP